MERTLTTKVTTKVCISRGCYVNIWTYVKWHSASLEDICL